jgi:hypothetical protein
MSEHTHTAVVQTGVKNEGTAEEKKFYTEVGRGWLTETTLGLVMNADFDSFPSKTSKVTFFPVKEKKPKK